MESVLGEVVLLSCMLLIPVFYEVNKTFRYYFKFFLYYGIIMLTSIIVIPIMVWRPGNVENLIIASFLCRHISSLLGLQFEIKGREYLEKDQAYIIIANHQSSLDILGMFEIWPVMKKCTVVAKKELFYAWPFGLAAWLCGLIFIDRLNSETARQAINNAVVQLKNDKAKKVVRLQTAAWIKFILVLHIFKIESLISLCPKYIRSESNKEYFQINLEALSHFCWHLYLNVRRFYSMKNLFSLLVFKTSPSFDHKWCIKLWVFPEGTRKNTGEIHEFKKGAFRAAISAQLPLLPIVFTQFYFLQNKDKQLDQGHIVMTVLPPIDTEGLTPSDVPRLMEEARTAMTTTFMSTSKTLKEQVNFVSKTD